VLSPRPYQHALIEAVRAQYAAGKRSVLAVLPTGSGKTVCAAWVIDAARDRGRKSLFVAGRIELVEQTVKKLREAGIDGIRVIQGKRDEGPADADVCVASIDTVKTERWASRLPPADLLICDESHHGSAKTWFRFLERYPHAHKLGLTATPERADGKPLGDLFESLVAGPSVRELIDLGHLVQPHVYPPAGGEKLDPTQVALDPVAAYQRHGEGERAIVFCVSRAHATMTAAEFNDAGMAAAVIDGSMAAGLRRDTLRRHRCGELRVLTSIGVLTEGYDDPGVTVAIMARGFGHPGLWLQCCGRVLRPSPGKTKAIIIDLVGNCWDHGSPDWDRTYSLDGKAISAGVVKDKIRQCKVCGCIRAVGRPCPNGCEVPAEPFAPPQALGMDLVKVNGPMAPKSQRVMVKAIISKRRGWCDSCRGVIAIGDEILWTVGSGHASHRYCRT
jgi:superfamily II DNA or RNA helicase